MISLKELMPHFYEMTFGNLTIWFSYETPIAFKNGNSIIRITQNTFSNTTGKHINYIKKQNSILDWLETPSDQFKKRIKRLIEIT